MGELASFCNMRKSFKTFILKCPNGRFTFRGSVPSVLCKEVTSGYSTSLQPRVFNTQIAATIAKVLFCGKEVT